MRTPYSTINANFSNRAHEYARDKIYPALFGVDRGQLVFDADTLLSDSARGRVLDGQMAVDRIVRVTVNRLRQPLVFTIQERFRRPKWADRRDITITEWNHATNQPSELYKLEANLFVYGYFNEQAPAFIEVVAVNTAALLQAIASSAVPYTVERNKRSNQSFLALTFNDLVAHGLLAYHYKPVQTKAAQVAPLTAVSATPKISPAADFKVKIAQYSTTCRYCKSPIQKQQKIARTDEHGWIHLDCAVAARAGSKAT